MNSVFSERILADKLSKLNSSQQCIETLSHWCIFHIDKAEQVVQTWDRQFHSSDREQKIPLLYLANDIIQNSRRKGNEFAIEFWKVLPAALKDVAEHGDERGKNVVSRLVGIWEERRVFGSRGQDLKDLMLGNNPMPTLELNKKRSRSVRILKRDSRSIKIRLSVGANAEKIISALHTVLSERHNEDADLNRCQAAVHRVRKMEKDVDVACNKKVGDRERVTLAKELQEQESIIKECVEKLKSFEANRADLVSHLREALNEQESELESVRTQLQVAQAQMEEAVNMCRRLNDEPPIPSTSVAQTSPNTSATERTKKSAADIAAEVADRLAASTHSQQIMTSVLSTFAAEEAKNAGLMPTSNLASSALANTAENGQKVDKPPMAGSQTRFVSAQSLGTTAAAHQPQTMFVHQPSIQNQAAVAQPQYSMFPAPSQQFVQPSGAVLIGVPYTYTSLPPPPPVQVVNLARPPLAQQQQTMAIMQAPPPPPPPPPPPIALQQSLSVNMQTVPVSLQPALPSYRPLQPPSMAYYQHRSQ